MSLPAAWIERIFQKLTLAYGQEFLNRWAGVNLSDVKTDWGHELSGFENKPEAIAFALQNLPAGKPPTVMQFRAMANQCPSSDAPRLPEPKADPQRLAAELSKLGQLRSHVASAERPGAKDWAHRIVARHAAGERINACTLRMAREALGVDRA